MVLAKLLVPVPVVLILTLRFWSLSAQSRTAMSKLKTVSPTSMNTALNVPTATNLVIPRKCVPQFAQQLMNLEIAQLVKAIYIQNILLLILM